MTARLRITVLIAAVAATLGLAAAQLNAQDGLRSPVLPEVIPNTPPPAVPPVDLFRVPPSTWQQPPTPIRPGRFGIPIYGQPIYNQGPTSPVTILVAPNGSLADLSDQDGSGFLRLNVSPLTTEVYIDGAYSGRAVDFDTRSGRPLRAGLRRIELRAPGGRTTSVALRVTAGETISYSGTLDIEPFVQAPREPAPKRTFYIIEGCYAGDSAPETARLRASCRNQPVKTVQR